MPDPSAHISWWAAAIKSDWLWLLLVAGSMVASIIFSGLETGLYTLSRLRLDLRVSRKEPAALRVKGWLEHPAGVLAGLLIWQNIANFLTSAGATVLMEHSHLGDVAQIILSVVLVTPLVLIFGEILPKDMFLSHTDSWTYKVSGVVQAALIVITVIPLLPALKVLDIITQKLIGSGEDETGEVTALMAFANESSAVGLISQTQYDLIQRTVRISGVKVSDVMVPWMRVVGVPKSLSRAGFAAVVRRYNLSRLPVLGKSADEVLGFVTVVDVLADTAPLDLTRHISPPLTLLAEQSVRSAMKLMQSSRQTIALVVTRQKRIIGMVTIKDLVEELIGDVEHI